MKQTKNQFCHFVTLILVCTPHPAHISISPIKPTTCWSQAIFLAKQCRTLIDSLHCLWNIFGPPPLHQAPVPKNIVSNNIGMVSSATKWCTQVDFVTLELISISFLLYAHPHTISPLYSTVINYCHQQSSAQQTQSRASYCPGSVVILTLIFSCLIPIKWCLNHLSCPAVVSYLTLCIYAANCTS